LAAKLFPRVKTSRLPGIRWTGMLTDLDAGKGELQLATPKTKGIPKALPVARDAVIQLMYGQVAVQELTLSQVATRVYATALVSPQDQQVTRLLVDTSAMRAKVRVLDAERGCLS